MAGEQYSFPQVPSYTSGFAIATEFGIVMPPGGRLAAMVRSTGVQQGDDRQIASFLVPTLASGLARCRAGLGDTVVVLPGHSESGVGTTMLSGLVAGTRIVGVGQGSMMPVFRWTAASDNWALAANDVFISGLRLRMEGANGVTEAITWTGSDCVLRDCDIETVSGASNKVTTAINLSAAGASRAKILNNTFRGTSAASSTNIISVSSTPDQVVIMGNKIMCSSTTTNGGINISGAATDILVASNWMHNSTAASTTCIAVADVASTGMICFNFCSVENNGTAANQGVVFAAVTTTKIRAFENKCSDEPGKSGALAPAVVAS